MGSTRWGGSWPTRWGSTRPVRSGNGRDTVYSPRTRIPLRSVGRGATLGGKPDLIAVLGDTGTIIDVKTGNPSPSHGVQVMLYMYAVPRAMEQHRGLVFDGRISYPDHDVVIPASSVDEAFIRNMSGLIRRLSDSQPARRVPSPRECGFCDISSLECGERMEGALAVEGETRDF